MHTYILRVWINGIQPQESRYRVSGIAVPENWNGGAIWAGFFILLIYRYSDEKNASPMFDSIMKIFNASNVQIYNMDDGLQIINKVN